MLDHTTNTCARRQAFDEFFLLQQAEAIRAACRSLIMSGNNDRDTKYYIPIFCKQVFEYSGRNMNGEGGAGGG